jgi:hypothetical protein
MCLSCGCGDPHGGHDDDDHITAKTIAKAAMANDNASFDETVANIVKGVEHMSPEDKQKAMDEAKGSGGSSSEGEKQPEGSAPPSM